MRARRATPQKISEADIERTCTELLEWDGWRALKTDPVSRREWGKGFGEKGMADYLYIRYQDSPQQWTQVSGSNATAEILWIEWKRRERYSKRERCWLPTKASEDQVDWHTLERKRGAVTLIAGVDFEASIEGFKAWYSASGLQR